MEAVLSQNYFMFQNKIYQPKKKKSLNGPTNLWHYSWNCFTASGKCTYKTAPWHNNIPVILYTSYVDVILIIYDTTQISTDQINKCVNKIHTNIKLNPTYKSNRCINYLYLFILRHLEKSSIFHVFVCPCNPDKVTNHSNFLNHDMPVHYTYSRAQ